MSSSKSFEVPNSAVPELGLGCIRRTLPPFGPELSLKGMRTVHEVFTYSAMQNPKNPCLGYRPIAKDGSAGDYIWLSYEEVASHAANFGHGLAHLKICPANEDGLKCLGFYAKNRLEWVIGEQGGYTKGITPVPLYDTLGADSVEYVVRQTGLKAIVCTPAECERVFSVASAGTGLITCIILMDVIKGSVSPAQLKELQAKGDQLGVKVYTMSQVEQLGKANPSSNAAPSSEDVAFFSYTSGTTGDPKGAMVHHSAFLSCLSAVAMIGTEMVESDVYLSYLPLPHVFERGMLIAAISGGARVAFYQGDPLKILDDIQCARPTMFASVPRLLNRIYDKVLQGVKEAGGVKQWLFETALASKLEGLKAGTQKHALWDRLVFGPLKKRLGFDRIRVMITGSAPISNQVLSFLRVVFACPVVEGYGQTESSLSISVSALDDFTAGHVGIPTSCCEVRLVDVADMGYKTTDKQHSDGSKCNGRGEIIFRGPNVFRGYYKMPEKTQETIDKDGWCYTGDIGLWTVDGKLRIIDRKKNIFKLSQGEYVAAEKIENVIARDPLIMMSFVYGDSLQSVLVAIVVPDPETLAARKMKANDPATKEALMKAILKQSKDGELKGFEYVKDIYVEETPFSAENGILTPTFKLKRNIAQERYQAQIDAMYAKINAQAQPSKL